MYGSVKQLLQNSMRSMLWLLEFRSGILPGFAEFSFMPDPHLLELVYPRLIMTVSDFSFHKINERRGREKNNKNWEK